MLRYQKSCEILLTFFQNGRDLLSVPVQYQFCGIRIPIRKNPKKNSDSCKDSDLDTVSTK
jgi:hypothetical protein